MDLDFIDKKILFELEKNSKLPFSRISKLVGASREVVNYRIERLEEKGIVKSYIAKINQSLFFSGVANLQLKLQRKSEKRFLEIIKFLKNHKSINWIGDICSNYDIALTFLYKDTQDISKIIDEISNFLKFELKEHSLSLYINEYKFSKSGLIFENKIKPISKNINFSHLNNNFNLDKEDKIILYELSKNCRIKNIELSKITKLSEDVVRLRIKKLEKNNYILGYTIVLDTNKINYEGYLIYLQIEQMNKDVIKTIKNYINSNPYICYCSRISGEFNLVLGLYCKNRMHFNKLLNELRIIFGVIIKDYKFQILLDEYKEVFITKKITD